MPSKLSISEEEPLISDLIYWLDSSGQKSPHQVEFDPSKYCLLSEPC